jgi:hypothetical protein
MTDDAVKQTRHEPSYETGTDNMGIREPHDGPIWAIVIREQDDFPVR